MLPYADDTPSFSPPIWIFILIALNVLVFISSYSGGHDQYIRTIFAYGTIPARFFQPADKPVELDQEVREYVRSAGIDQSDWPAPFLTLFTAMFLHGGLFHLLGNMWFLWLFGDNVEDRLGKLVFPIFFLICGFVASLLHVVTQHTSVVPAVGASGAIAGVMGAYIYLFPRGSIATLMSWGFYFTTTNISAPIYIGLWFILQLLGGLASGGGSNVAFWAHIGGFVAGVLLAMLLSTVRRITWYPGDRGYISPVTGVFRQGGLPPIVLGPPTRKKRRYVWRD